MYMLMMPQYNLVISIKVSKKNFKVEAVANLFQNPTIQTDACHFEIFRQEF